jgi:hypothetical protein
MNFSNHEIGVAREPAVLECRLHKASPAAVLIVAAAEHAVSNYLAYAIPKRPSFVEYLVPP